jgi:heme oxygenase
MLLVNTSDMEIPAMAIGCKPDLSRRFRLRAATAAAHQRLDGIVQAGAFLASRNRYCEYLQATLRARRVVEAHQATVLFPAWPSRKLSDALQADLRDLGRPIDIKDCAEAPAYDVGGTGGVVGALYVLEGSALGARILSAQAADLGLGPAFGARHMFLQTANPTAWRAFLEILEALPFEPEDEALCLAGAERTFEFFESELSNASVDL